MNFLADNDELLKYIKIWNKIKALFNKKFNEKGWLLNKPVYNNKYINTLGCLIQGGTHLLIFRIFSDPPPGPY